MPAMVAAFAVACTLGLLPTDAAAQAAKAPAATAAAAPAAKPSAPPTPAQRAFNRGLEAYKAGKLARAIGAFSSALSTGGLASSDLARTLYFRGLAYRKQGKPAQSISDLTSAIWLSDGLDPTERADAIATRSAAYRDAGLPDPGVPAGAASVAAASPAAPAPAASATGRTGNGWQTAGVPEVKPKTTPAPAPAAPPAASGSTGIGGFFSNLFGGGSSSASAPAPEGEVTTSSTGTAPAGAPSAAVSSWSSGTEVAEGRKARVSGGRTQTAALSEPAPAAAKAAAPLKGKYKLQVAVLRSEAEARQLAAKFEREHADKIGRRSTAVEEAVFGNMGTFYRVNIGPFANAAEPGKLCDSLRPGGYDCLVVTH
ncbi:MAG: SPOR domain-containing protein [Hyphomicrobiaceae bacterium]|nr:SPOR domain-containing protein [Hyphomicrobiaceae bacterium]